MDLSKHDIIILAAGDGRRFNGTSKLPKMLCKYRGRTILEHIIARILPQKFARIIIAAHPAHLKKFQDLIGHHPIILTPGSTQGRIYSIRKALELCQGDYIWIHDGARCCIDSIIIHRIYDALKTAEAAFPVMPITNTVTQIHAQGHIQHIERDTLRLHQTPQAARRDLWIKAFHTYLEYPMPGADDITLLYLSGIKNIVAVQGDLSCKKITYASDIIR